METVHALLAPSVPFRFCKLRRAASSEAARVFRGDDELCRGVRAVAERAAPERPVAERAAERPARP